MTHDLERRREGPTSYLIGGEGPVVLFLHGIPGSADAWTSVASELQDRYRVIVPDLLGFGRSAPSVDDYYMVGQARAVAALLDALDVSSFSLVTHDFGGPVGLTLLRDHSEFQLARLVLASTNVFTDTYVPPPLRIASVPVVGTLAFGAFVGNRFGLRLLYQQAVARKDALPWSRFQRHLTPSAMTQTRRIFQRSLADMEANYGSIEAMLPDLDVPALVLWGDRDPFFDVTVGERTTGALPDARFVRFERTGHFVPEERPGDVAEELRTFLAA